MVPRCMVPQVNMISDVKSRQDYVVFNVIVDSGVRVLLSIV